MNLPFILCSLTLLLLLCSVAYVIKQTENYDFDTEIEPLTPEEIENLSGKQKDVFWFMTLSQFSRLSEQQKNAFRKVYNF